MTATPDTAVRALIPDHSHALIVNQAFGWIAPFTYASVADCECGKATFTAVSGSPQGCARLIRNKHRRHLPHCTRRYDLESLGLTGMTRIQATLALELGARVVTSPFWDSP